MSWTTDLWPQEFFKALITHTQTRQLLILKFYQRRETKEISVHKYCSCRGLLLIHWNFSIPLTGGELADPYYGWVHILQGCYYLLNPFSWRGGTRLYQTLVCCFQNMKWLYKSWESKIWGCAELMIHPYWVHLDKICLRSVKHLIKKFWAIKHQGHHRSFHLLSCDIIIHSENEENSLISFL